MKQLKATLLATAAVIAVPFCAAAADLSGSLKDPVDHSPVHNWAGFYGGIVAGGGLYQQTTPPYYYGDYYGNQKDDGGGAVVGGTLGVNFQRSHLVYGIEADYSWSDLSIKAHDVYYGGGYYGMKGGWDQIATLRARAGLAVSNTMAFLTAGLAFVNVDQAFCYYGVAGCSGNNYYDVRNKGWKLGFAVGTGIEHALSERISIKADYLYIGLPSEKGKSDYETYEGYVGQNFSSSANLARLGLNFKF